MTTPKLAEESLLAFDVIEGKGQPMFNVALDASKEWAEVASRQGKGIRIVLMSGDKYRVEVVAHAIEPGQIKYMFYDALDNPSTLEVV
jgi:hypothetical protein